MDDEKFALYTFGVSFLAAIVYALVVNLAGLNGIIGVFLLFALAVFVLFSDKITQELINQ